MKRVLQIDGGGVLGIIPLSVLVALEAVTGKQCYQLFDLMSGTSTGSIICGMLATGVPAQVLFDMYVKQGEVLFDKRCWYSSLIAPKYDRSKLMGTLYDMVRKYGKGAGKMGDTKTKFISAAFNRTSGRTHFQMSWDDYHKGLDIVQVISWSALSAVHYFGPICVPDYQYTVDYQVDLPFVTKGAVFFDGGQGRNNCTLGECITTCVLLDYVGHSDLTHVLSLGCGDVRLGKSYGDCVKDDEAIEITDYLSEARNEGVYDQLSKAYALSEHLTDLKVYRLDIVLPSAQNVLDSFKNIPNYVAYGESLKNRIPQIFKAV